MRYVSVILADVPVHTMFIDILFVLHSLKQKRYKRVLNFVQQVFFLLSTEGSLVITRAYPALYLGGTPSQETGTSPPCCLLLENRLYITVKAYFKQHSECAAPRCCSKFKKEISINFYLRLFSDRRLSDRRYPQYMYSDHNNNPDHGIEIVGSLTIA